MFFLLVLRVHRGPLTGEPVPATEWLELVRPVTTQIHVHLSTQSGRRTHSQALREVARARIQGVPRRTKARSAWSSANGCIAAWRSRIASSVAPKAAS